MAFEVTAKPAPILVSVQSSDGTVIKTLTFLVAPKVGDFIQTQNETLVVFAVYHVLDGLTNGAASYVVRVAAIPEQE